MIGVLIKNKINYTIYILKRLRLNILYKVDYKNIFFVELLSKTIISKPLSKALKLYKILSKTLDLILNSSANKSNKSIIIN